MSTDPSIRTVATPNSLLIGEVMFTDNKSKNQTLLPKNPPLSSVVTAHTAGHLRDNKTYRRYAGSLTSVFFLWLRVALSPVIVVK